MNDSDLREALVHLADIAARVVCEPNRFARNDDGLQQALSGAVASARTVNDLVNEVQDGYTITLRWTRGNDLDAMRLHEAITALARAVDEDAKCLMTGQGNAGRGWIGYHRAKAAAWRRRLHGVSA